MFGYPIWYSRNLKYQTNNLYVVIGLDRAWLQADMAFMVFLKPCGLLIFILTINLSGDKTYIKLLLMSLWSLLWYY